MPTTSIVGHPLIKLAQAAVETYIYEHRMLVPRYPLKAELREKRGVFVTLLRDSQLRGSIGTLRPTQPNLALEVIMNAVAAANRDPRFTPVKPPELLELTFVIDLVCDLEAIDPSQLSEQDPQQHGLAVCYAQRTGIMLPGVENVTTAEQQLEHALTKGLLEEDAPYSLWRFQVERLT